MTPPRAGRDGSRPSVGILYPGELGSALGALLVTRGVDVYTTVAGRSDRSATLASAAGMTVLASVRDVLSAAVYVVSSVPPAAAVANARSIASQLPGDGRSRVFVDINSIAPTTMASIAGAFEGSGVCVLDAAVHGQASTLGSTATLYLSGCGAEAASALIGTPPRVVVLGDGVGQASLFKMLLAGVNKGVVALMLELSELAGREGVLESFWAASRAAYPGVMDPFARLLPSYPRHIGRRAEEMGELEATVSTSGGTPIMAAAVRRTFEAAARRPESLQALVDAATADRRDAPMTGADRAAAVDPAEIVLENGPASPGRR